MAEPYRITYGGFGHQTGERDTTRAVRFIVERDGATFAFECAMSRQALLGFPDLEGDDLEVLLANAGLDELQRRLGAGLFPPDQGELDFVTFTSDQHDHLNAIAERNKYCLWQERFPRGWVCTATEPGGDDRTTATLCGRCEIPDERVICAELAHPVVSLMNGPKRTPISAWCNVGNDAGNGSECRPGGLDCWRRHLDVGLALPDPPANVAELATDEIDYFVLVYRDRYGSKVWSIPQARSITELFGMCESAEDFSHRLAALADLLSKLDPYGELDEKEQTDENGNRVGSLVALRRVMERDYPEAVAAVQRLRRIVQARNQFPQHSGSKELLEAFRELGVDFPASDWRLAWLQVLTAFWSSLRAIRLAIQAGPPPNASEEADSA